VFSLSPSLPPSLTHSLMYSLGRLLQLIGLTVPPLSIVMQLMDSIKANQMLVMLLASVCAFGIGRILEGYGR
jgi:hypothetical protein